MSHPGNDWLAEKELEEYEENEDKYKCNVCRKYFLGYSNNGDPLVDGEVCNDCNQYVLLARLYPSQLNTVWKIIKREVWATAHKE